MDNILTLEQVAELLGRSTRTIRFWEKINRLRRMQSEGGLAFHRFDVDRLKDCINRDIPVSRRPIQIYFDSLRKPPLTIDCLGHHYCAKRNLIMKK